MRILVVCPLLPYPLTDGGKKAVYYPIKYLAMRGHQINLACLSKRHDPQSVKELEKYCEVDVVLHSSKPTMGGAFASLFSGTPYDLRRFRDENLLTRIRSLLTKHRFDVIQLEGIHTAFYGLEMKKEFDTPIVMRVVHVHSVNMQRLASQTRNVLLKTMLEYETRKIRRFETLVGDCIDLHLAISEHDHQIVLGQNPRNRCVTVPAGVDLHEFAPGCNHEEERSILWMGALSWRPNQDSFWWFYNEIVPTIIEKRPNVSIYIVGSNPPDNILSIRHPNVKVLGFVEDVREYIQKAQVCVVPLRVGSGIRIKLLEMFAMEKAVVSTTIGCEGLNVKNGEHLLVADDSELFAHSVLRLLSDPSLRQILGANGLAHVRQHFSWEKIAQAYEQAYESVAYERNIRIV